MLILLHITSIHVVSHVDLTLVISTELTKQIEFCFLLKLRLNIIHIFNSLKCFSKTLKNNNYETIHTSICVYVICMILIKYVVF